MCFAHPAGPMAFESISARLVAWLLGCLVGCRHADSVHNPIVVSATAKTWRNCIRGPAKTWRLDLMALNLIRSTACERLSQDSTLEKAEGDPVASSCLHRLMPQLSSDFTARSDLNTFRRLATDVKHRVSREPVYGGFGARVCPQSSPEESELAV